VPTVSASDIERQRAVAPLDEVGDVFPRFAARLVEGFGDGVVRIA
jgi:hypothetical protein